MNQSENLCDEIKKLSNLTNRYIRQNKNNSNQNKLTRTQHIIILYIYGNQKDGKTVYQKDIENHFMIRRSTATELLKKLEKVGYLIRKPSLLDARLKDLILTKKSINIAKDANQSVKNLNDILGQNITKEEISVLKNIIQKMQNNLLKELNDEKNS